ncbi:alpha/beta fold hydrolase [Achromobacter sp. DH1f]|uniref:alpha/beta fold hydrolase n=1 Tax=Achromobacter sp. DH1f TaxID=1397275 RepID=UPI0004688540|nr:alpha/beta hydrolase [Achromobacter sp. DH1f]
MANAPAQAACHAPASRYLRCEGRELHYTEWGAPDAPALIMWHGLARTGRDFDELAQALAGDYRIICPDTIGRGLSQWSPDPVAEYQLEFYARLARTLLDSLSLTRVRWVGTSMGGATGMLAAATTLKGRISHLVVNDIGPTLPQPAIARILAYAGNPPAFDTVTELETWLRAAYKPYGWQSDEQWRRMAETSVRRLPDGRVTAHYDPAIVGQFSHHPADYERWTEYDSLDMPLLLLRGADSDLLLPEVAHAMTQRGPRAERIDFPDCGHAPALNVTPQIDAIRRFLAMSAAIDAAGNQ